MAKKNRDAKESVDLINLSVVTARSDETEKVYISDVLDRQGSILSDRRTGVGRHVARFDAVNDKEAYPIINEAGSNTGTVLNNTTLTAVAPVVNVQLEADRMSRVQFIRILATAMAAGRTLTCDLWDGTNFVRIYFSGIAAVIGGEDGLIFPTDEFTAVATYPGSRNSFDMHEGTFLRFTATGLVAAETMTFFIHMITKDTGGLRA